MNKTPEAVIFSAGIPFALFNTGTYASTYDQSEMQLVIFAMYGMKVIDSPETVLRTTQPQKGSVAKKIKLIKLACT